MKRIKREIEKFLYGTIEGLSEDEAGENMKLFLQIMKNYGLTVLRISLFVYLMPTCSFAEGNNVAPSSNTPPTGLSVTKEVLEVAAVYIVCASAANPVTALGVGTCALVIAAKSLNKL